MDWGREIADQLSWHWQNHIWPKLAGLSDEEYLWQPVPGSWSLLPRAEAKTEMPAGAGDWVMDFEFPEPSPAPVTTIAWRLAHVLVGLFGMRNAAHFGGPPTDYQSAIWPTTAAEMLDQLAEGYDRWSKGVAGLSDEDWTRPIGAAEGVFAERPYSALVLHINREVIHHMAEVLVLRDLYRHQA